MKVKKIALVIAVLSLLILGYQPAQAGVNVGIGVSIDLPFFFLPAPPQLVVIPGTYAYYVADVDVDIIFYDGRWYRPWDGRWYWARGYNGPWFVAGPRFVPAPLWRLPKDYRHGRVYTRVPYYDLNRNWRRWERERHWERNHDWWQRGREEDRYRRDLRKDRRDFQRDRRDMQRDRGSMNRDQMKQKQQRPAGKQKGQHNKQPDRGQR